MRLFEIFSSFLVEMANIPPRKTGIEYPIWIGEVGGRHGPRIKVSNIKNKTIPSDTFVMTISANPEIKEKQSCKLKSDEVEDIEDWVKLNLEDLLILYKMYENNGFYEKDPALKIKDILLRLKKL